MHIEKLEIKGFGKLNNLTLGFSKGLNIIYGHNESGKTSIQSFIKGVLYGLKGGRAGRDGSLPAIKKFKPWNAADYNGFMEYYLDDNELYRVGRSFSNNTVRIFDKLFNDVTGNFDISKERGALFAEEHLGINEACFEKTVFIKQMDTRIDDDGSRELLDKLTNLSQTGFEDVSFRKAQEALKEALKSYVGTEKTSTRPMDKVLGRIEELRSSRTEIIEKRNNLFSVETRLNEMCEVRNRLEARKSFLLQGKEVLAARRTMEKEKLDAEVILEIYNKVKNTEAEIQKVEECIKDFNFTKEEYKKYGAFNNDDADNLALEYRRMQELMEKNSLLEESIKLKKREKRELEEQFENLKAFKLLEEDKTDILLEIGSELELKKTESIKLNPVVLDERLKGERYKYKILTINSGAAILWGAVFALLGAFSFPAGYFIAPVGPAAFMILFVLRAKRRKIIKQLTCDRELLLRDKEVIEKEIAKNRKLVDDILNGAGAKSIEEYLNLKARFEGQKLQLENITVQIRRLQEELDGNLQSIGIIKTKINKLLLNSGIIDSVHYRITEDYINAFKYGIRRYNALEPSINYSSQRLEDLKAYLSELYSKASNIAGKEIEGLLSLSGLKDEMSERAVKLQEEMAAKLEKFEEHCSSSNMTLFNTPGCREKLALHDLNETGSMLEQEYGKVSDDFNNAVLQIKEYETIIKSSVTDEEEIHRIDEELEELQSRKNQLEDINITLKLSLDILTEASSEIQRDFVPALNVMISDILERITGGRYRDVKADSNLMLKAVAPETGEIVNASVLSGGTVDQIYLALRIAMARLITNQGESLPFIMDEVFAQYDDIRVEETMKYLKELSKERQLLLFTCKGREVEIARKVCGDDANIIELV